MKSRKWWAAIGAAIAAAGMGIGYAAYAQTGTNGLQPPHLIPYQGYLEDAQGPVNTTGTPLDVTFFITTGPADAYTETCIEASGCIWKETDPLVIANGYFSTVLGDGVSLAGKFGGSDRYLGIRVGTVTLEGRQRLLASPYAITAATAQDFRVEGTLSTGSTITVNGTGDVLVAGGIRAGGTTDVPTGDVFATGTVTFGKLSGFVTSGEYFINSTTPVQMTPSASSVCFLTGQTIVADTSGAVTLSQANCRIAASNSYWVLSTETINNTSAALFVCRARCLRWD